MYSMVSYITTQYMTYRSQHNISIFCSISVFTDSSMYTPLFSNVASSLFTQDELDHERIQVATDRMSKNSEE